MPSAQNATPRASEVEAQPDLPHKGRSELSRNEMRAAQYTPESEGPGLDRAPEIGDARFERKDAAPNEHLAEAAEEKGRTQRSST